MNHNADTFQLARYIIYCTVFYIPQTWLATIHNIPSCPLQVERSTATNINVVIELTSAGVAILNNKLLNIAVRL